MLERARETFLAFRQKVWEFVSGSALQLETQTKKGSGGGKAVAAEVDIMRLPWVPDKQLFGNASTEVRKYLVMAAVFQVLYSRILRPGLKTFGAEVEEEMDYGRETRRVERQLRDIEGWLGRQGQGMFFFFFFFIC